MQLQTDAPKIRREVAGRCWFDPTVHEHHRSSCGNDSRRLAHHEHSSDPWETTCRGCKEDELWQEAIAMEPRPLQLGRQ